MDAPVNAACSQEVYVRTCLEYHFMLIDIFEDSSFCLLSI